MRVVLIFAVCATLGLSLSARAQDALREEVKRREPKLTKAPQLLRFVEAAYPKSAVAKGVQGTVNLILELGLDGRVRKTEVTSSPDPELSRAAEEAAKQFLFSPAEVDGKPAPVRIEYAYNFVLGQTFVPRLPRWMREGAAATASEDAVVGRVREQGTRLPLPGAAVVIRERGIEVRADERGAFAVPSLPPGKYRIEAFTPEHKREVLDLSIEEGEQAKIDFYVSRLQENPYETVVRGTRRKTVVSRVTLRQKELTTVPGTFGDPLRVIENLPGVARIPYVGGALLIRGASPQDSGVYLDGIKIPILYHFLGGPSVLHPEFLDRIDYYPGNADVRYGRLTAGVVDVATRNAFTEQIGGSVDVNLLNTGVMLKVPITKRVSVAAAVRRSYIDAILPSILKLSDRSATTVVPIYYDYQLRVDVKLHGDDTLFLLAFGSDDSLGVASNQPEDKVNVTLDTRTSFHRLLAQWRWQITKNLSSRLTPSVGIDYVNFDTGQSTVDLQTLVFGLREDLELRLSKRLTLRTGTDLSVERGSFQAEVPALADYRNPGSGVSTLWTEYTQPVDIDQTTLGLGVFADAIIGIGPRLQLIPGVRAEFMRTFERNDFYVDPRLTARYSLWPKTTLKAAVGHFSVGPQPREVSEEFGNPNLHLEHAVHLSAGLEQRILAALGVDVQFFYIARYNQIVPTKQVATEGNTVRPLNYSNEGNGYSYGLEVLLKHDVTERFYGWLAYTLSRSCKQREPGGEYRLFGLDQTHILTLVASLRLGRGWELGTRFRLVSGRPDTPILGGVFDSDLNRYRQIRGELDSIRMPFFHQLDLRIEKTWMFELWRLSAYLDVQNVYNAENPEMTLYDYRFKQSAPLRGLPIVPALGIKGSF